MAELSMLKHSIRRLQPSDARLLRDLRLLGLRISPETFGSSHDEEAARPLDWFEAKLRSDIIVGAEEASGQLCGMAAVQRMQPVKQCHKGMVWGIFVRPDSRGAGLGNMLVARLLEECQGSVEELRLTVSASNPNARDVYLREGFVEFGFEERSLKIGDRYIAEYHMAKRLPK